MQSIFSNALSRAVAKHIDLSVTRRETLSWLALLIMQHGTICLWRLAAYVAIHLRMAGRMRQRNKGLSPARPFDPHMILDDRVAAREPMLVA